MVHSPPRFAPAAVEVQDLDGGGCRAGSPQPLGPYRPRLGAFLQRWAQEAPERTFLAERTAEGAWRRLTYSEAWTTARGVGQALLDRKLGPERPVMVLSENGIDHALLALGAMEVGVAVAPVSTAYSLLGGDLVKLRQIAAVLAPGLVYARSSSRFAAALAALEAPGCEQVTDDGGLGTTPVRDLLRREPTAAVEEAAARVGPDTVAKLLFTSGSTGEPKGVINTHRMLCSNQQALEQVWPFLVEEPPILVDWLPWNHTFGGNFCFDVVLAHGGTLHVDAGRPLPGAFDTTLANLREVSPTLYLNVPRAFDLLVSALETDEALRTRFFERLRLVIYAGAALPSHLWDRLQALSRRQVGGQVTMVSSWGSTETAPMATMVHYEIDRAGIIGLPVPGTEIKLVPVGAKLEMRVRGPNVTPGYWRREDLTRAAFDEEGFLKTGDAGRWADPDHPARGLVFDGRIAEDFKLTSGTWVHVGALRVRALAALAPLAADAVVAGHDRDWIGLLLFASAAGCRQLCPDLPEDAPMSVLASRPEVRRHLAEGLRKLRAEGGGSSTWAARAAILLEPPSIERGEITDKGYLNQRAALLHRREWVERLYREPPPPEVVCVDEEGRVEF